MQIRSINTTSYEGQKPGTSGLRKRVKVFQQENYTQNFIQATLDAMPSPGEEAIQIIIRVAAGNRVD